MRAHIAKFILGFFSLLPLPLNHAFGSAIGWLSWVLPNRSRRVTEINLKRCFPEQDARWRRRIAKQSLAHTGRALTEASYLWRHGHRGVKKLIRQVSGREAVIEALAEGRGVIAVSPHIGAWEMAGLYMASLSPMATMYRPPRLAALDETIRRGRASTGAELAPANAKGVKMLIKSLARGHSVGILPDQSPKKGTGVFAPFFGLPAYSMVLLNRLAARHHIPVFFAFAERLPFARGYHMHFVPAEEGLYDADPQTAATAMNKMVETLARSLPAQYMWSYKRFEPQPEGERGFYDRP